MNESQEIKVLKQRISILETEMENVKSLFVAFYNTMEEINYRPHFCECGMNIVDAAEGSCMNSDCPHGLNP